MIQYSGGPEMIDNQKVFLSSEIFIIASDGSSTTNSGKVQYPHEVEWSGGIRVTAGRE